MGKGSILSKFVYAQFVYASSIWTTKWSERGTKAEHGHRG